MNKILTAGRHMSRYSATLHTHTSYKLIYCTSGSGRIEFETDAQSYTKGDLLVLEPGVLHRNQPADNFNAIYLSIDLLPLKIDRILVVADTTTGALAQCLFQIEQFYTMDFFNKDGILYSYGTLLNNLIVALSELKKISPVIEWIKDGIFTHFSEASFDINALLAYETSYNTNYLKKLFKKEVGTSPQQFLIQTRLNHATQLLAAEITEDKLSISQIAYACGYEDPLYFSRAFKIHYGISPKAFYHEVHC